jgi:hypothetical protein
MNAHEVDEKGFPAVRGSREALIVVTIPLFLYPADPYSDILIQKKDQYAPPHSTSMAQNNQHRQNLDAPSALLLGNALN